MPTPPDLDRIAFVTRAYPRMRAAILSIGFGPIVIWLARGIRRENAGEVLIALAALLAATFLLRVPERWLDRRFGTVIEHSERMRGQMWFVGLGLLLWKIEQWSLAWGGPPVIILALAGVGLWISIRDWPFRPQVLIFTFVCAIAAASLVSSAANGTARLPLLMRADAVAILAWMLVGFFDLLMLSRVMPRRRAAEHAEKDHADTL